MKWELEDLPQIFANFFNSPDTSNHEVGFDMLKGFNAKDVDAFAAKYFGKLLTSKFGNWKGLITLQTLDLRNNRLASLPAEIGNLNALQWLYLENNQLASLPAEIGKLGALQTLDLNDNQLASIPAEFGNLGALQWLYLENNPISKAEQKRIKELLPNCEIYF